MTEVFTKQPHGPRSAEAEAAGLRWLREASDVVVEVVSLEPDSNRLQTRLVAEVSPTQEAAEQAGRELAHIHRAGAEAFGAPPAGWEGPNYIGTREQECTPEEDWGRFYAEQRVLPFARRAHVAGNLDDAGLAVVEGACEAILERQGQWGVTPARLHGDLWAGNLLFGEKGPVFIDPAAHGGHPLTDLAMLALFGVPFREDVWRGYQAITPLPADFREQFPMHQLHPLAVHTLTHGRGYARLLVRAARATLARLA